MCDLVPIKEVVSRCLLYWHVLSTPYRTCWQPDCWLDINRLEEPLVSRLVVITTIHLIQTVYMYIGPAFPEIY